MCNATFFITENMQMIADIVMLCCQLVWYFIPTIITIPAESSDCH